MIDPNATWMVNNGGGPRGQNLGAKPALSCLVHPPCSASEDAACCVTILFRRFLREAMSSYLLPENAARNDVNFHSLDVHDGSPWLPSSTNQTGPPRILKQHGEAADDKQQPGES